jgi:hypothetical protein
VYNPPKTLLSRPDKTTTTVGIEEMKKKNTEPLVIEIENERKPRELLLVD